MQAMFRSITGTVAGIIALGALIAGIHYAERAFSPSDHPPHVEEELTIPEKNTQEVLPRNDTVATTTPTTSPPTVKLAPPVKPPATAPSIPAESQPVIPPQTTVPETIPTTPLSAPTSTPNFLGVNEATREALVNIMCTSEAGGPFAAISGSGIIIDSKGVILTNAHIAQYYLIKDYGRKNALNCLIRSGSPATVMYRAELIFISPRWIETNYQKILEATPAGTGQYDYAFLLITESAREGVALPSSFPFIAPAIADTNPTGKEMLLAAYPAGFLGGILIQTNLTISSTMGVVNRVFHYEPGTIDIMNFPGSLLSQRGASGGAVVNAEKMLMGLIVTTTEGATTGDRDLQAITTAYINRQLSLESGLTLTQMLGANLPKLVEQFKQERLPSLSELLLSQI